MSDCEYFELKYLEEIFQLFRECQEISKFNNLNLLLKSEDNFMDLFDFIYSSIEECETNANNSDESEEEEYLSYNIDASKNK